VMDDTVMLTADFQVPLSYLQSGQFLSFHVVKPHSYWPVCFLSVNNRLNR